MKEKKTRIRWRRENGRDPAPLKEIKKYIK